MSEVQQYYYQSMQFLWAEITSRKHLKIGMYSYVTTTWFCIYQQHLFQQNDINVAIKLYQQTRQT